MLIWLKRTILLMIAIPFFLLLLWYVSSFIFYLNDLKDFAVSGTRIAESIKHPFYKLVIAGETKEGIHSYAIRQAYRSLVFDKKRGSMLSWHLNNMLWYQASRLHFSESEIFGIWIQCALSACDQGIREVSYKYFAKDIIDLSERELASLVALVKSPSIYAPSTVNGAKRTNEILERFKTQNKLD